MLSPVNSANRLTDSDNISIEGLSCLSYLDIPILLNPFAFFKASIALGPLTLISSPAIRNLISDAMNIKAIKNRVVSLLQPYLALSKTSRSFLPSTCSSLSIYSWMDTMASFLRLILPSLFTISK